MQSLRGSSATVAYDNEDQTGLVEKPIVNNVADLRPVEAEDDSSGEAALQEAVRMAEAIVFAAGEPIHEAVIAERLPEGVAIDQVMAQLQQDYAGRGVVPVRIGDCWRFRTAEDLSYLLQTEMVEQRKLSRAALETLAIIAYHQPVTRAEIEDIRGVSLSRGVLDVLLELGWIKMRGRRRTPGRPLTFGTTVAFLDHFGLESLRDLPGKDDLKGAGLLDPALPLEFSMPQADDQPDLAPDEDPLEADDPELSLHPRQESDDAADEDAIADPDDSVNTMADQSIRSLQDEATLDRIRDTLLGRD